MTLQLRPRRISAGLHLDLGVSTNFEWKMANVDSGRAAETHSMESFSEHSGSLPSSQHEERQKVVGPLDWEGPNDPANPWNWPVSKRWYGTLVPGSLCFLVTFASSVYVPGVYEVAAKFDVSITVALLGISMYVVGLGLGPMFSAPLSEVFGRKMVYFF